VNESVVLSPLTNVPPRSPRHTKPCNGTCDEAAWRPPWIRRRHRLRRW
jgi:hypothetical protein